MGSGKFSEFLFRTNHQKLLWKIAAPEIIKNRKLLKIYAKTFKMGFILVKLQAHNVKLYSKIDTFTHSFKNVYFIEHLSMVISTYFYGGAHYRNVC